MSEIIFKNVSKVFPGHPPVIEDFNFTVRSGEFLVILGGSGCGKTTLLRLLSGLEDVSSGKITIDGEDVTWLEPKRRNIAMVFQNYALYPHMTVLENIMYPLALIKATAKEKDELAQSTAKMLRIDNILSKRPGEISGGQRQRVAIGRALVRKPRVFLFDEPLSNLDARLRDELRFEISKLKAQLGITTLFVTHDQHEAMALGDRMMIMNNGRIEQAGNPEELYNNPATLFCAEFLGSPSINLLDGIGDETGRAYCEAVGFALGKSGAVNQGEPCHVGIRPENLKLADGPGEQRAEAIVEVKEFSGGRCSCYLRCGTAGLWHSTTSSVPEKGNKVWLDFSGKHLIFNSSGSVLP